MPVLYPSKIRRSHLPGADRRVRRDVRTSDVVLAVTLVGLLGAFCLVLLASLVGASEELAAVSTAANAL